MIDRVHSATTFIKYQSEYNIDMDKPIEKLTKKEIDIVFNGNNEMIHYNFRTRSGNEMNQLEENIGVLKYLERRYMETTSDFVREWLKGYAVEQDCPVCHGSRLKEDVLNIYINKKNIDDLCRLSIKNLYEFIDIAVNAGFNIKIAGTTQGAGAVVSYKQSVAKDTTAEIGTVITVYFSSSENVTD